MSGDPGPGYGTAFHPEPDLLPNGHDGPPGPAALRSLPRRRRPVMIFLAVALVGAGIVASAALYQRANHQVPPRARRCASSASAPTTRCRCW